ncbi:MAG: ECF transporter S component [Theionarchaea archaeon]|nr:ECF transporter S component [Theionarchaea archaeon]
MLGMIIIYRRNATFTMTEEKESKFNSYQLMISAIFAAAVIVATLIIRVPVPATSGYINLGDSMVFISALLFGARVGGIAGGIGSALADIIGGYASWAPFTLVIKGLEGTVVGHLGKSDSITRQLLAVVVGGLIMVSGYFIVEVFLYGAPAAITEVPGNLIQAGSGLIISMIVVRAIKKAMPERF